VQGQAQGRLRRPQMLLPLLRAQGRVAATALQIQG
jgi:hypothetical protein